ncbi:MULTISPECIES: hypothetical protein [unclassified Nonomuraea]|uniref:ATP-dependent DNA ligase n=1 Tax=unclassified Nonomuraea TaxID=2593643 RepID=UPI0033F27B4B
MPAPCWHSPSTTCPNRPVATEGVFYEPKYDGYRALARIDNDGGVQLQLRHGTRLNEMFPELAFALWEHLPKRTIVEGEIVRWSEAGRLDFEALQRRVGGGQRYLW